jgi:hypothetical protein
VKSLTPFAAILVLTACVSAAEPLKSGPQVNEQLAGPFEPLNVTGPNAGKENCLYCENGENPVAMVFARELSPTLVRLIKVLDQTAVKNQGASMGTFVVFCSADKALPEKLKALAKEQALRKMVLAIDKPAGPEGYKVAKDADVTVVLYTRMTVQANHAFRKGELTEKSIEQIAKDVAKILPAK